MKLEAFVEKFDLFANMPEAVEKMRELALRLAFSGRLTGKSPGNDGLPIGWKKRTIESICSSITSGFACSRSHQVEDGHVHLRTHNISTLGTLNFDLLVRIDPKMVDPAKSSIRRGDILFNNTNSQELVGKTSLVDRDYDYGFSNHITRLRLKEDVYPEFVAFYLTLLRNSGYFSKICTRWINQAAVNIDMLKEQTILLPLIAEQKRIVAKVNELMVLCDRFEVQQQEKEAQRAALARASLARFGGAPTPTNLHFLFHDFYDIAPADLRKSILTLAVQGKLVPQDPNDEPAGELVASIRRDSNRIAKVKGARAPKNVPPLTPDDYPHTIPESWQWSRVGDLALLIDYGTSQKANNDSSKVPVYRMGNIVGGRIVDENLKYVDASIDDLPGLYLKTHDILFNRTNSYELVGKVGIYTGQDNAATFASYLIRVRLPAAFLFPPFFCLAMNAPYFRQTQIEPQIVQQCGQANFNGTKLASTIVPVPPLLEQRRIVARVNELMALVDALEAQLATARAIAPQLWEAAVHNLTVGTPNRPNKHFARALLSAEIVHRLHAEPTFGRVKHQKIFHLCEHIAEITEIGGRYHREAAGPLDNHLVYANETELKRQQWYVKVSRSSFGHAYTPLAKAGGHRRYLERLWSKELPTITNLIELMRGWDTDRCEIFSTAYAAWNDLLLWGRDPTDEAILHEILERWNPAKRRFARERWLAAINWMRKQGYSPKGFGQPTTTSE